MADKAEQSEQLYAMRHSLAQIMAAAIQQLWPAAKFGVGPVVDNGFYYDVDLGEAKLSEDDFAKIETAMRAIIDRNETFEKFEQPIDEAIAWADKAQQPYKKELLNDLKRSGTTEASKLSPEEMGTIANGNAVVENVSFYKNGDFVDYAAARTLHQLAKSARLNSTVSPVLIGAVMKKMLNCNEFTV